MSYYTGPSDYHKMPVRWSRDEKTAPVPGWGMWLSDVHHKPQIIGASGFGFFGQDDGGDAAASDGGDAGGGDAGDSNGPVAPAAPAAPSGSGTGPGAVSPGIMSGSGSTGSGSSMGLVLGGVAAVALVGYLVFRKKR